MISEERCIKCGDLLPIGTRVYAIPRGDDQVYEHVRCPEKPVISFTAPVNHE